MKLVQKFVTRTLLGALCLAMATLQPGCVLVHPDSMPVPAEMDDSCGGCQSPDCAYCAQFTQPGSSRSDVNLVSAQPPVAGPSEVIPPGEVIAPPVQQPMASGSVGPAYPPCEGAGIESIDDCPITYPACRAIDAIENFPQPIAPPGPRGRFFPVPTRPAFSPRPEWYGGY